MRARLLTRRSLIGTLGLSALGLLAASRAHGVISPGPGFDPASPAAAAKGIPDHPPRRSPSRAGTLFVGAPDADPAAVALARELHRFLAGRLPDRTVEWGATGDAAPTVIISTTAPAAPGAGYERQRLTQLFAPVTNWRLPLNFIGSGDLAKIYAGHLIDWSVLGSPIAGPIERLDLLSANAPLPPGVTPPIAPVATFPDYESLVAGLEAHPGGIALVPLGAIDFRVQALAVDGNDPLAGRADLAAYPLQRELWLSWDGALGQGVRAALTAFAAGADDGAPFASDIGGGGASRSGSPVNLTVAGDIIFGRTVHSRMVRYGDWAHPMRGVAPRLRTADLTIADLECSLSDNTAKPADPLTFYFTTNAAAVAGLTLAGIDGVSLANNHSMNFGKLGLLDTIDTLGGAGITHFGGGANLAEARRPGMFEVKGIKIAFLGYDGISADEYGAGADWAGTCPLDGQFVVEDIAAARAAGADLVVPFFHWSEEYVAVPSRYMRRMAHLAIDNGAGLVLGSHPHWVQGTEWYRGAPILYSLGNFVFDQEWSLETKQGMFAEIVLRRDTRGGTRAVRPVRVRLVPVLIEDYNRPRILDLEEGLPVLQRVHDATDEIRTMG
ncbi:MAG: hypothetical protein AVDCRST_MAG88-415 [uncultured Thermomicrobiales bacterium]|uniref:Capsule synthesis protein CapA domain-containing protein n=1 Tax=uncultured Thermomicrobiales bacterium TaxID=1645740 RepID=A0A6J4UBS8_9BACT|nr:MAG: hypothetical protein AVDCRST_MAG88-415 [uncultured Thermomicrobiales bacterium]